MVLQSIRERLTGILAFTILGILVIPFAFVGVNQYFTSSSGNLVARVNDKEISYNDFNQSYSDYRRQMQSLMGASFDPEEFDTLKAKREHLDNMINQTLITQAATSMGLAVDDATLSEKIKSIPAFQVDGKFNLDVYQSRLTVQGLTPKQFEREIRSQIIVSQLPQNIGQGSIATPAELKAFVALVNQARTFGAVMVPAKVPEKIEGDGGFSEQEINDWYKAHPSDYQSEEQVVIQYIELNAADMPKGEPPTEDYLHEQFESQKSRFVTPEQRKVAHILIAVAPDADEAAKETAKQKAEDLAKRARNGEDFAKLAKEYSDDKGSAAKGG
ncbi:MAG: SurA N-terminal domain-containing protein, partial [Lysobacterales bacterium]